MPGATLNTRTLTPNIQGASTVTSDETIRDRLRMLAAVDESLGRILDALAKQGALDDTIVLRRLLPRPR
jgi:membrane-anchored protein YejM (alkaline phosphatase superfamily)